MALMSKDRLLELQGEMQMRNGLSVHQLRTRVAHLEQQVEAYKKLLIGGLDELDPIVGDPFRPKRKYTLKP